MIQVLSRKDIERLQKVLFEKQSCMFGISRRYDTLLSIIKSSKEMRDKAPEFIDAPLLSRPACYLPSAHLHYGPTMGHERRSGGYAENTSTPRLTDSLSHSNSMKSSSCIHGAAAERRHADGILICPLQVCISAVLCCGTTLKS